MRVSSSLPTLKVLCVSRKVGGQVSVAPQAGASGLAAEWRPGEEPEVHVERAVQKPFRQHLCGVNLWSHVQTMTVRICILPRMMCIFLPRFLREK